MDECAGLAMEGSVMYRLVHVFLSLILGRCAGINFFFFLFYVIAREMICIYLHQRIELRFSVIRCCCVMHFVQAEYMLRADDV